MAATADSTSINETDFGAERARARRLNDSQRNELNVLAKQAVNDYVEDKSRNDGIYEESPRPENESSNQYGYSRPSQDDVHRLIREAFHERERVWLRRLLDDRCKRIVLARFEKTRERAKGSVYVPIFKVMEPTVMKGLCTKKNRRATRRQHG